MGLTHFYVLMWLQSAESMFDGDAFRRLGKEAHRLHRSHSRCLSLPLRAQAMLLLSSRRSGTSDNISRIPKSLYATTMCQDRKTMERSPAKRVEMNMIFFFPSAPVPQCCSFIPVELHSQQPLCPFQTTNCLFAFFLAVLQISVSGAGNWLCCK